MKRIHVREPARRALGQWFTAAPIAQLAVAALGDLGGARVIDPMCGDGAFLAVATGARERIGIELDPAAAAIARQRTGATVIAGDALALDPAALGAFDLALGNPPYLRAGTIAPAVRRARAEQLVADWPELPREWVDGLARYADVAASCLLRALRLLRPGGRLALVVSTALLDADGAAPLWHALARIARIDALVVAPGERWFADAAVNAMLIVATRADAPMPSRPRLLRLRVPTAIAACARGLDDLVRSCDERRATAGDPARWASELRAPPAWFAFRDAAGDRLVPLGTLAELRRGVTTGANDVFYLPRARAVQLRLERRFLAPVVRSPFNGAPASIALVPDGSPVVAIALPPDRAVLRRAPRIAAWLHAHADAADRTSVRRRDPWWSLPAHPARLFLAKAYGPRFVQRLAPTPMLADQRVYALAPRAGVELASLAAVLNALPTALALESLGRGSMGYGVIEWTVADALQLPVLDVRRADTHAHARLAAALHALGDRPIAHVRHERAAADRARLDDAAVAIAPGTARLVAPMWEALLASVALRDRYLLPAVGDTIGA